MKEIVRFNAKLFLKYSSDSFFQLVDTRRKWKDIAGDIYHAHQGAMPLYNIDLMVSFKAGDMVNVNGSEVAEESTMFFCVSIEGMKHSNPVILWYDGADVICVKGKLLAEGVEQPLSKMEEKEFCFIGSEVACDWSFQNSANTQVLADRVQLHKLKMLFLIGLSKAVRHWVSDNLLNICGSSCYLIVILTVVVIIK